MITTTATEFRCNLTDITFNTSHNIIYILYQPSLDVSGFLFFTGQLQADTFRTANLSMNHTILPTYTHTPTQAPSLSASPTQSRTTTPSPTSSPTSTPVPTGTITPIPTSTTTNTPTPPRLLSYNISNAPVTGRAFVLQFRVPAGAAPAKLTDHFLLAPVTDFTRTAEKLLGNAPAEHGMHSQVRLVLARRFAGMWLLLFAGQGAVT